MSEKELKVRIQQKHDIEANWIKAVSFVPKAGEIIIYDADNIHLQPRIKIGNGIETVGDLDFVDSTDSTVPAWAKEPNKPTYTKSEVGLGNVDNTSDANKPVSTAQATAIADAKKAGTDAQSNLTTHTNNKSNPHGVTKSQVGLSNVDNVKQYSISNPPIVAQDVAPTNTSVMWIDTSDNTSDDFSDAVNDVLAQAKANGEFDFISYEAQTLTGEQKAQARTNIGAVTQADINAAVSNVMPEFVDSVEQMTDRNKKYVLKSTGTIWVYGETVHEAPNLYDPATAKLNKRLDSSMNEVTLDGKLLLPRVDFDMTNPCYLRVKGITPVVNYAAYLNVVYVSSTGTKVAGKAFTTYESDNGDYLYDLYNSNATGATKMQAWISVTASTAITNDDLTGVSITLDNQAYTKTGFYDTGMAWSVGANDTAELKVQINEISESVSDLEREYTSLRGKKIVYDGDSIFAYSRHANPIAQITGSTFVNQAVSSAWISATTEKHSVVNNLANLPTDGDLYCFEGGINDFWNDVPIGTVTTSYTGTVDNNTICGAMETIFRYAQNNFVGKPICFVIVHKISNTATAKNNNGVTFTDFHDAMIKVCEKYSIPYYDAFKHSGLNVNVEAHKTNYCPDLVHPNDEGHKRYYVPQLISLFREIMPY